MTLNCWKVGTTNYGNANIAVILRLFLAPHMFIGLSIGNIPPAPG